MLMSAISRARLQA